LLLTAAPVQALQREAEFISNSRHHLDVLNTMLFHLIGEDRHAVTLRATLGRFNHAFFSVVYQMDDIVADIRSFYSVDEQDFSGQSLDQPISRERINALLDPAYQNRSLDTAEAIVSRCEKSLKIFREDLAPLFPVVADELNSFVEEYIDRDQQMQARAMLWLPGLFLDYLWGPLDPPKRDVADIEPLPNEFASIRRILEKLPAFLQNIQSHFLRISEVAKAGIDSLGYKTFADLEKLYQDRLECGQYARMMQRHWGKLVATFSKKAFGDTPFFSKSMLS
jgi:hypothetical protein